MDHEWFYIFGLQRTGTRWLEESAKANRQYLAAANKEYPDYVNWGKPWKHLIDITSAENFDKSLPCFVLIKSPYTWIESLIYRDPVDFFERQDLYHKLNEDGGTMVNGVNIEALAKMWGLFYRHWIFQSYPEHIDYDKVWIFRFEDLINHSIRNDILKTAFTKFWGGLDPPKWRLGHVQWCPLDQLFFWPQGTIWDCPDYDQAREDYYKDQVPMHLTSDHISVINANLDKYSLLRMGYKLLS